MSKTIDFTTRKKEYLTIKLNDAKKTTLMIGTPTRNILAEFVSINERVGDESGADMDTINDLYNVCAKIMSFNKGGIEITAEYLGDFFDVEDILVFFNAYGEFMGSVTNAKN